MEFYIDKNKLEIEYDHKNRWADLTYKDEYESRRFSIT